MESQKDTKNSALIENMFKAGAHFGYARSRRHPSIASFIFGVKNKVEIIDLEKTTDLLHKAKDFIKKIASERGQILFASSKNEAREALKSAAESIEMPYVAGRWIGGTFTNFPEIRKRVERLEMLTSQKEKGELGKYTKKERLLIDREIDNLNRFFSGILPMRQLPKAVFVIDSEKENIAVKEADKLGIPVVALVGSDCNIKDVKYPILANDSSARSIKFFLGEIIEAYKEGKMMQPKETAKPVQK